MSDDPPRGLRQIGIVDFEGGGFVRIQATGDVPTLAALQAVEEILAMKRRELTRLELQRRTSDQSQDKP